MPLQSVIRCRRGQERQRPRGSGSPFALPFPAILLLVYFLSGWVVPAAADDPLLEQFELREPTWKIHTDSNNSLEGQQRSEIAGRTDRGELIRLQSTLDGSIVRLSHVLPAARVLDELTAGVWVRSDRVGWELSLEVQLPSLPDPKTRQPVRFLVKGDTYQAAGVWQQLKVRTTALAMQQRITLLRAQHGNLNELGPMVVGRLWLSGRLPTGASSLHFDDLSFGPIVPPEPTAAIPSPEVEGTVVPQTPTVEFRLDRLLVNGRPFFPLMVPYHGEPPELLRELGFNVVWIPDLNDTRLIRRLWEQGLWVTATPSRPTDDQGAPLQSGSAGLLPFSGELDPVLFWMLGTRIPGDQRQDLSHWIEQIEFADRRRSRPIAADVAFGEQFYSRRVAMVGISRHGLQSSLTFDDYRLWLQDRRSLARPGTFCWTWLQTEPATAVQQSAASAGQVAVIEPEQLRMQAYAAIVAGCRGLGFWSTGSLAGTTPTEVERRLAIRRLNLELKLLEPWLTTAGGVQQIACAATLPTLPATSRNLSFGVDQGSAMEREAQLRTRAADARQRKTLETELTAFVLRSEFGQLVLPMWLEGRSQFVPAQGAISGVQLVIPGSEQAATAFELSTTQLRSVRAERVAGGLKVDLPALDEVGFLWVTSDMSLVDRVRQRITLVQAESTSSLLELATLKLDRVGLIDQQLQEIAPAQPDAPQKIGRAKLRLERARSSLDNLDYPSATRYSSEVLQLLRLLQRDHWDAAVVHLSAPVSSPYTLSFQTLPEHWKLVSNFGASRERESRNLLPSGEFEDFDTLVAESWQNVHRAPDIVQTSASLFPTGRKGRYSLRLECLPTPSAPIPPVLDEPAVTVTTPPIPVRVGQILHISGWVKLNAPITGSRDGLLIYDSLLGRSGAQRIRTADQWTRFEMLRVVPSSGEFTLTMSLTGMGSALIDDLQVIPHESRTHSPIAGGGPEIEQTSHNRLFDRFPKLPRMLQPRQDD